MQSANMSFHPAIRSSLEISPAGQSAVTSGTNTNAYASRNPSQEYARSTRTAPYFRSRRVPKGEYEKPWLNEKKDPREKWTRIIPWIAITIGFIVVAALVYVGYSSVQTNTFCPVLDETFSSGTLDAKVWTKEVEVGGFGNGQFEETTNTDENAFIKNGQLYIKPTVQDSKLVESNNVINLLKDGCTGSTWASCVAVTNTTNGTIVNPVKSARLNTKAGASIKYGKVEVVAQMPAGDWMWPAIWMLPVNNTYGQWPASGEIDIFESRGNNYSYPSGGNNIMSSALHLGPSTGEDSWWRYLNSKTALHSTFPEKFHTFGMEWTDKYIFTYLDSKPLQVLFVKFVEDFWARNEYPPADANGTRFVDIWSQTGHKSTPFDQNFYLILNVGVGESNRRLANTLQKLTMNYR